MAQDSEIGMLEKQRKHIKSNINKLIKNTDFDILLNGCVEWFLLSPVMRDEILRIRDPLVELPQHELRLKRHNELFLKITKRGPEAYEQLKRLCHHLNFDVATNILNGLDGEDNDPSFQSIHMNKIIGPERQPEMDGSILSQQSGDDSCPLLQPFAGAANPTKKHTVIKSKSQQTDSVLGVYPMRTKRRRGTLFLVNLKDFKHNDRRNGAEEDTNALIDLFQQLNFTIFSYYNLTQSHFFKLLRELLSSDYVRGTECFVLALMSHGEIHNSKQMVEFPEGSIVNVQQIIELFRHENCPLLIDIPKILIFPFCRGKGVDSGYYPSNPKQSIRTFGMADNKIETDGRRMTPHTNKSSRADMIIAYASTEGYETHRCPVGGSWYIQIFCEMMAMYAHNRHFDDILKLIQEEVLKKRSEMNSLQTGSYLNEGWNRALFFNPGWWDIE